MNVEFTHLIAAIDITLQWGPDMLAQTEPLAKTRQGPRRVFTLAAPSPLRLINSHEDPRWRQAVDVLHDIGHLWVAPKSRRDKQDFGIPLGSLGDPFWDFDDNKACLVENELARLLRIKPRYGKNPYRHTEIVSRCTEDSRFNVQALKRWWEHYGKRRTNLLFKRAMSPGPRPISLDP